MTQKQKPLIGVLPLYDEKKESYWMLPGYMDGLLHAGGIPVMFPLTEDEETIRRLAQEYDGFLFTGGHDVAPELYHEKRKATCDATCVARDRMEKALFWEVYRLDKPILGICRGIQLINAVMGGTLYQDLATERPSAIEHHQHPPYDRSVHSDRIVKGTPLFDLLSDLLQGPDQTDLPVNSYHHSAIKDLAPGLDVMAVSEDGLIEAVYVKQKRFLWAVQWHPEFSWESDESSRRIFQKFVEA